MMTLAQIRLAAIERQIKAVYRFAMATAEQCGGRHNPASERLIRSALRSVWEASLIFDRAERRARR